jgi:HSP20 family molecular chaperone IbpA
MRPEQRAGGNEAFLRRYEYDDRWIIAADLGVGEDDVDVDVVGETAIVVVDDADRVREMELELPGPGAEIATNNGVLTIEIAK